MAAVITPSPRLRRLDALDAPQRIEQPASQRLARARSGRCRHSLKPPRRASPLRVPPIGADIALADAREAQVVGALSDCQRQCGGAHVSVQLQQQKCLCGTRDGCSALRGRGERGWFATEASATLPYSTDDARPG